MQNLGYSWANAQPSTFNEIHIERDWPLHRGARQLLESWMARQVEGRFIVGRDVPSRELARVLSGLALFQPISNGDFRVRLAGMALRRRFGRDVTGEKLSEIMSEAQFGEHGQRMRDLLESGKPFVVEIRLNESGRLRLCYEWLALRVFAADGVTPWVMTGIFFS
jgi:hypothetical protein